MDPQFWLYVCKIKKSDESVVRPGLYGWKLALQSPTGRQPWLGASWIVFNIDITGGHWELAEHNVNTHSRQRAIRRTKVHRRAPFSAGSLMVGTRCGRITPKLWISGTFEQASSQWTGMQTRTLENVEEANKQKENRNRPWKATWRHTILSSARKYWGPAPWP